jgi:Flp pilus assembly pilin Flp
MTMRREFQEQKPERGASMVEYALLIALISFVCMIALQSVAQGVGDRLTDVSDEINSAGEQFGG